MQERSGWTRENVLLRSESGDLFMANSKLMTILKHIAHLISHEERLILSRELEALRPSILQLGEDLLQYLCTLLDPIDRLSYLNALCRCDRLSVYLRRHPSLVAVMLLESAYQTLCTSLHQFAERILYVIPQVSQTTVVVLCNWSLFRNRSPRALMTVLWSPVYPHMRVEVCRDVLRRVIGTNLGRYTPVLRLVAYRKLTSGVGFRVNGVSTKTDQGPILWHQCNLLENCDRDGLAILQRPDVQQMVRTESRRNLVSGI